MVGLKVATKVDNLVECWAAYLAWNAVAPSEKRLAGKLVA